MVPVVIEGAVGNARLVGEGFVTVAQAAEFLGLSRSTVYSLMETGEIRFAKFHRARRIPRTALLDFAARSVLASRCAGTGHRRSRIAGS